mgnify:CR=1 FL=1|nr:MAG TPA: hypothetical protein [Caudoviricetes sp.]
MANRPGTLCNLKSGMAIGAQANFADTFNWLVAAMKNLKGGKGIKVKWPSSDTPEISAEGEDDGEGEGGGDGTTVAFTGTDQSQTIRGTDFTFASATDSNVVVTCEDDVITLGVYYT